MLVINAHFKRLADISLVDAYDEIGVYVLWNGKAAVRPTYIGEGDVLKRFVDHVDKDWAARPLAGSMAFVNHGTRRQNKASAELIESLLLSIADYKHRSPLKNKAAGKARSSLTRLLQRQDHNVGVVRIKISGQDPLHPPERPAMPRSKCITLRRVSDGHWRVDHAWRARS